MARDTIDQLAKSLAESVPGVLRTAGQDLEKNFRAVLKSGLSRLDLVTREEFEVQQAVLARSRQKLEALEARLADIEALSTGLGRQSGGATDGPKAAAKRGGRKSAKQSADKKSGKRKTAKKKPR